MAEPVIQLESDDGWHHRGSSFAKGNAFIGDKLLRGPGLAKLADESEQSLGDIAQTLIGEFGFVRLDGRSIELAVDGIRSIPLYYVSEPDTVYVSDHPRRIVPRLEQYTFDPVAEFEFLLAGIVSGPDTLYEEVKTVQAGEVVTIALRGSGPKVSSTAHFDYVPTGNSERSKQALLGQLDRVLERAIGRLTEVADGRQIAVSLSGGYDSRLVCSLLARSEYPHVMTFSFGRQGNPESTVGQRVANSLGLPWTNVEYSNDRWRDWYASRDRYEYYTSAFDLGSLPSIGACPALQALSTSHVIDDDAVVVSGDSITTTGEHLPPEFLDSATLPPSTVTETVRELQYSLWDHEGTDRPLLDARIRDRLEGPFGSGGLPPGALERWDWRERQSKFIVSPVEYGHWGFQSWLPLFDREYMAFWREVPVRYRMRKSLHTDYVDEVFASQAGSESRPVSGGGVTPPLAHLKQRVAETRLGPVLRPAYEAARGTSPFLRDDLAQYGILEESQFERLHTGRENIHSFKVLDITGRVSISPAVNRFPPDRGVVRYEPTVSDWLQNVRRGLPWFPLDSS